MVKEYLQSLVSVPTTELALKREEEYLDKYKELNQEYYDKQMLHATNLFNRNYYRNYLDTPTAQRMLKQVREQLGEQTRSLRNTSTVMGLTGESMAAMQKNNNKAIDNVVISLATTDERQKEAALHNYENVRSKLDDFLFNVRKEDMTKRNALNEKFIANKEGAYIPLLHGVLDFVGDIADAGLNKWKEQMMKGV